MVSVQTGKLTAKAQRRKELKDVDLYFTAFFWVNPLIEVYERNWISPLGKKPNKRNFR